MIHTWRVVIIDRDSDGLNVADVHLSPGVEPNTDLLIRWDLLGGAANDNQ